MDLITTGDGLEAPSQSLAEHLARFSRSLTERSDLTAGGTAAVEALSRAYVLASIDELGWRWNEGRRFTAWELMRELGILPKYDRLIMRLLSKWEEDSLLSHAGVHWRVLRAPQASSPDDVIRQLEVSPGGQQSVVALLKQCAPRFAGVLKGELSALEVLFPNGDSSLLRAVYSEHPAAQIMNTVLTEAFERLIGGLSSNPRALEAGAGTGGTTSYVADVLRRCHCEYVFTDVSTFFLSTARQRFADVAGMSFCTLNLDAAPEDQGFQPRRFDIVVAANMLHACRSVRDSLAHVLRLLRPGGSLLLLETTHPMRWLDLVFGLTDGWWAFADYRLRMDYALMSSAQWLGALAEVGLTKSFAVDNRAANQSVFVCSAP